MMYYVNKNAQTNGDHEVHQSTCTRLPTSANRIYLGDFTSCAPAVRKAKEYYVTADGCFHCSPSCHTS